MKAIQMDVIKMISDVLKESIEKIKEYQKMDCYVNFQMDIDAVVSVMEELKRRLDD